MALSKDAEAFLICRYFCPVAGERKARHWSEEAHALGIRKQGASA